MTKMAWLNILVIKQIAQTFYLDLLFARHMCKFLPLHPSETKAMIMQGQRAPRRQWPLLLRLAAAYLTDILLISLLVWLFGVSAIV